MTRSLLRRATRRRVIEGLLAFGASAGLCRSGGAEIKTPRQGQAATHHPGTQLDAANAAWLKLPPTPTLPGATRSGLAAVNGASIYFAQFGDGPAVLLLHGGLANSNYWGHQVRRLAESFSVTVMDTRGHGRSPVTSHSFSYGLFAQDAVGLLDFLKIPEAAIVGWSDGAITGLQLAMTQRSRVSRLFAFGANSTVAGLKPDGAKSQVFATFTNRSKTEYAQLSPHPERWPQLVDGLRGMWRTEPKFTKKDLAAIKIPTAISDGEYDEIIKRDDTEGMARAIPDARLVIQPGVSHFAMLQNPAQFNEALIGFLSAPN
jgi:pimeloyl-ACP methyl ester carboxylesterase